MVNGPEDVFDWDAVIWRTHEENVARLRGRIFKATREQDWATARSLQKMMLRSWSNTLLSVRQVTQRNAGRATAGIDGRVALTAQARAEVAVQVHATRGSWRPVAVKRAYIHTGVDSRRGPGRRVQRHRPWSSSRGTREVPGAGDDRRLAHGRGGRGRGGVHAHPAGRAARRCDQSADLEHRPAW